MHPVRSLGRLGALIAVAVLGGCSTAPSASLAAAGGSSGPTKSAPLVQSTSAPPTPLELALSAIRPDGTWTKDTALAAFVASFGPLPGVPAPASDDPVESGTLALDMIAPYWSDLTDAQRAAIRAFVGPDAAEALPASYQVDDVLSTARQMVNQAVADIAAHLGHGLGIPIAVGAGPGATHPNSYAWAVGNWVTPGQPANACIVTIVPSRVGDPATLRFVLLHEVWHCYEDALVSQAAKQNIAPWLGEGEAQWVAEAITNGAGATPGLVRWWRDYIEHPETALYARSYDAEGFYAQLAKAGINPWGVVEPMYTAGDSVAAFEASGANSTGFLDTWGSSWYRDGTPTSAWAMADGYGIPSTDERPLPGGSELADDGNDVFDAPATTASLIDLHTTAFVTHIDAHGGARIGDPAGSLDQVVRDGGADLCTNAGGDCSCPPGTGPNPTSPPVAGQDLRLAVTGGEDTPTEVTVTGISKDEWCRPKPTGLNLFVTGQIGGRAVNGQIVGYPAPILTCDAMTSGGKQIGNIVHWSGFAATTKQMLGGEFDVEFGTWTIGTAVGDRTITIDALDQHPDELIGGVSGTITQNQTGGSVDAIASLGADTVTVKGTWTCPTG